MTSGIASAASVIPATTSRESQSRREGRVLPNSESPSTALGEAVAMFGSALTSSQASHPGGMKHECRAPATLGGGTTIEGQTDGTRHPKLKESFGTPRWLRDLGRSSWLLVGLLLVVVGLI